MNIVQFAKEDVVVVDEAVLQSLRSQALTAPLKRARLCLHRTSDDPIQEMVIAFTRESYVRVHRHRNKSESFHLLEGQLQVVLFDDQGQETRRIRLGAPGSGLPSLYRLSCDAWHTVLIDSDSVIMHETTNGPFVPGETEFAEWAPDGSQVDDVLTFVNRLRAAGEPKPASASFPVPQGASLASVSTSSTAPQTGPTLTAIICNYNHGKYVSRAIEAMVTQSRPADELIIVDDGSTDDSVAVIRSWIARYPFIRFLQNERNLGFHASFRRALDVATSDFIYSGAADDRVLPGFFEGAMQLAGKYPDTGVICGQFISVDPTGRPLSTHGLERFQESVFLEPARYREEVLKVEPATHSLSAATMIRRQALLDAGGYPVELGSWGDTFAIQAVGLRYGFCYWPHPAMEWTIIPGSMSQATRSDPRKSLKIVNFAAKRMRSDPFRDLFPADYVEQWARRFQQSIVHEQLNGAIEGNQAVQVCLRSVAASAKGPIGWLLDGLGFGMRAIYFITFRVMRFVVARQIAQLDRGQKLLLASHRSTNFQAGDADHGQ